MNILQQVKEEVWKSSCTWLPKVIKNKFNKKDLIMSEQEKLLDTLGKKYKVIITDPDVRIWHIDLDNRGSYIIYNKNREQFSIAYEGSPLPYTASIDVIKQYI